MLENYVVIIVITLVINSNYSYNSLITVLFSLMEEKNGL